MTARIQASQTAEQQCIRDHEREVRTFKENNVILNVASILFARELDPRRR